MRARIGGAIVRAAKIGGGILLALLAACVLLVWSCVRHEEAQTRFWRAPVQPGTLESSVLDAVAEGLARRATAVPLDQILARAGIRDLRSICIATEYYHQAELDAAVRASPAMQHLAFIEPAYLLFLVSERSHEVVRFQASHAASGAWVPPSTNSKCVAASPATAMLCLDRRKGATQLDLSTGEQACAE